jgi:diguanylate cyclase (GGDEF)-like protein
VRILIVDDSMHIHAQLKAMLASGGYSDLIFASSANDALGCLSMDGSAKAMEPIDLVLMDVVMPEMDGIEACRRIKAVEHLKDMPVIMVTAGNTPEGLQAAFDAGAIDYIAKPLNKVELIARVSSVLKLKQEMDTRKERERQLLQTAELLEDANKRLHDAIEQLRHLSNMDGLTGVSNRRRFEEVFIEEWNRACRFKEPLSVIMIDIDCFKAYNDTYGHQKGDECLRRVAGAMQSSLKRAGDFVARYGGEEFVVVLPGIGISDALKTAEMLQEKVKALCIPHASSASCSHVSLSMGVASVAPDQNHTQKELIEAADKALYAAKAGGRNRVKIFNAPKS